MVLVRFRQHCAKQIKNSGEMYRKTILLHAFSKQLVLARQHPILYNSEKKAKSVGSVGSSVRLKTCVVDCVFISWHSGMLVNQLKLIATNRKLNFYASFRKDTRKTGCLDVINNPHHRIAINKFRLGNHELRIETGRHNSENSSKFENLLFLPLK